MRHVDLRPGVLSLAGQEGNGFPITRLRRLRRTEALRTMVRENQVTAADLVLPIFVDETSDEPVPIASMPGVSRIPAQRLAYQVEAIARDGVRALMLFGVAANKDAIGSDTLSPTGLMARMTRAAKDAAPGLVVITDNCFCEYTDHGHCGVLTADGHVHNDQTIENLGRQAVVAAEAGADMVAPSAMMDGQITAIRTALDRAGSSRCRSCPTRASSRRPFTARSGRLPAATCRATARATKPTR